MKVYEFGADHAPTLAMFQCAVEPWWVFKASAEAMARNYRVFLFITDGHDESGTDFASIEKNVDQTVAWLRARGVTRLDAAYGVSMGGASLVRLLALGQMPVGKAIIDAGITPTPTPGPSAG